MKIRFYFLLILLTAPRLGCPAPNVVTSIPPLHAIASDIMQDVGPVKLLINNGGSPHGFRLQPSAAMLLQKADLTVWIGPDLESKMARSIRQFSQNGRLLTVLDLTLPVKLHNRRPGVLTDDGHEHTHESTDPHVWLDPGNAIAVAESVCEVLSEIDPRHAEIYYKNTGRLIQSIKKTDRQNFNLLKPVSDKRFVILHDALQYFENHYRLGSIATLTLDAHNAGSAKRLTQLKTAIADEKVNCVLHEQMADNTVVEVLLEGSNAHAVEIDPLGLEVSLKKGGYPKLLKQLAKTVYGCLAETD